MRTETASTEFEALYRAHYPALMRLGYLLTGSNEVAEDLVHDVFLRASLPGAAYDPVRRAWRPLAALAAEHLPETRAVWTGRQALLWAGGDDGWSYDLSADRWSTFDAGGLRERANPVVWADGMLVGWAGIHDGSVRGDRVAGDGVRYRPPS